MKLTGSEIVAECLIEQGVDTVFGYPGGTILNIYDALYKYQDMQLMAMQDRLVKLVCVWQHQDLELQI